MASDCNFPICVWFRWLHHLCKENRWKGTTKTSWRFSWWCLLKTSVKAFGRTYRKKPYKILMMLNCIVFSLFSLNRMLKKKHHRIWTLAFSTEPLTTMISKTHLLPNIPLLFGQQSSSLNQKKTSSKAQQILTTMVFPNLPRQKPTEPHPWGLFWGHQPEPSSLHG